MASNESLQIDGECILSLNSEENHETGFGKRPISELVIMRETSQVAAGLMTQYLDIHLLDRLWMSSDL